MASIRNLLNRLTTESLSRHFDDVHNRTVYLLSIIAFIIIAFKDGIGQAFLVSAAIAYVIAGWVVVLHLVFAIMHKKLRLGASEGLAYAYLVPAGLFGLYYFGFERRAIVLLLPLVTGLILALLVLFRLYVKPPR